MPKLALFAFSREFICQSMNYSGTYVYQEIQDIFFFKIQDIFYSNSTITK